MPHRRRRIIGAEEIVAQINQDREEAGLEEIGRAQLTEVDSGFFSRPFVDTSIYASDLDFGSGAPIRSRAERGAYHEFHGTEDEAFERDEY